MIDNLPLHLCGGRKGGSVDNRPYTVARLAEHWDVSETFVRDEIKRGRLEAMRFGGKLIRIPVSAVEEYEGRSFTGATSGTEAELLADIVPTSEISAARVRQAAREVRSVRLRRL